MRAKHRLLELTSLGVLSALLVSPVVAQPAGLGQTPGAGQPLGATGQTLGGSADAAAGTPIETGPAYGMPSASGPANGTPMASAPAYGAPNASGPASGMPMASAPAYGTPMASAPAYGPPNVSGQPAPQTMNQANATQNQSAPGATPSGETSIAKAAPDSAGNTASDVPGLYDMPMASSPSSEAATGQALGAAGQAVGGKAGQALGAFGQSLRTPAPTPGVSTGNTPSNYPPR